MPENQFQRAGGPNAFGGNDPRYAPGKDHSETAVASETDRASEDYPSVQTAEGERIHVYRDGDGWCVWLNTEAGDFDGLCIASGLPTRNAACASAVAALEAAIDVLQAPTLGNTRK